MHGLLTGKYSNTVEFPKGDFRENIGAFRDIDVINLFQKNTELLKNRFKNHPNPVVHGVIDTLVSDSKNSCVLLGQRNKKQVEVASSLGETVSDNDRKWIKSIYRN
jgi:hypothetical protein